MGTWLNLVGKYKVHRPGDRGLNSMEKQPISFFLIRTRQYSALFFFLKLIKKHVNRTQFYIGILTLFIPIFFSELVQQPEVGVVY